MNRILNMPLVLNMPKFLIWQDYQYASSTQLSEYARICLGRVLNISWVLNIPGFWIWQGSQHASVTQCSKYVTTWLNISEYDVNMPEYVCILTTDRVLNIYHTVHSARSRYKLISTYWEIGVFRTGSKI